MSELEAIGFGVQKFVPNDKFLRRIPPLHLKKSGEISSAAFQNTSGTNRMSTNWMKLSSVEDTLRDYPYFGVASITAELCWELSQEIEWTPAEDSVAHCDVVGNKTASISKKFRDGAEYLKFPKRPDY